MATSTAFKQECPSCEALVTIRDPKLIGKKTECPKCKFKFVVKAPPEEDGEEEKKEEGVQSKPAKKAKKSDENGKITEKTKPGKAKKGKGDDVDVKKKDKKKLSPVMVGSLAVGAVLALGIGGYVMFSGPSDSKPKTPAKAGQPQPLGNTGQSGTGETTKNDTTGNTGKTESAKVGNLTNLLPADTVGVCSINIDRLQGSPLWSLAVGENGGAFQRGAFAETFGFPLYADNKERGVSRVIIASNPKANWVFSVVRTLHDVDRDELAKRLRLGKEIKAGDATYQIVGRQFDSLGSLLFKGCKPCDSFAIHFVDARTLIFADEEPLKEYLDARAKATDKKEPTGSYATIPAPLRAIMDRMESGKDPALLSFAGDVSILTNELARNRDALSRQVKSVLPKAPEGSPPLIDLEGFLPTMDALFKEKLARTGLGLVQFTESRLVLNVGFECNTDETATAWNQFLDPLVKGLTMGSGMVPIMPPPPMGMGENKPPDAVTLLLADKLFVLSLDVPINKGQYDQFKSGFAKDVAQLKSDADLAYTGPRHHHLAAALKKYVETHDSHFPPATLGDEKASDIEVMRRLSWAAALLPYLPESLSQDGKPIGQPYDKVAVNAKEKWNVGPNMKAAEMIIPHFIVRSKGRAGFSVNYEGTARQVGASHWVGMAGVSYDAARLPMSDERVGIFGIDRITKKGDIPTDRLDKVIALIQVPAASVNPWIAGGGSTLLGVADGKSEKDNPLEPFLSEFDVRKDGKVEKIRGTYAIMADGAVRFISDKVKPDEFRAMCQLKSTFKFSNFDELVPLVKNEELEAAVPVAPPEKPPVETTPEKPKPKPDPMKPDPMKPDPMKPAPTGPAGPKPGGLSGPAGPKS